MPNIPTYADNETYIGFLELSDEKRKRLRTSFIEEIKDSIKDEIEARGKINE